jgi:arylsulfatase
MYEQVVRVPLIVWSPGNVAAGKRVEGLCQLMDVGPTVLELAGIAPPTHMAAQSLLPALQGKGDWTPRNFVFAEQVRDKNLTGTDFVTMVRDKRWKLVHFIDDSSGQLFDLESDPEEANNLWEDPASEAQKRRLLNTLLEWRIRTSLHTKDHAALHR